MDDINGVLWDGTFYYKDLTSAVKLSWQQFNHNLETIKNVSESIGDQLDIATRSAAAALASQKAAALSETAAINAKTASEAAKGLSEEANTFAQAAKDTAVSAKDTAVSANTTAQSAKTAAELARNDSVAARNIAQTSATAATNAKNAAETARNTATQKANEANQSAIDAEYWAGLSEESAGEVTSVQGKKGKVDLKRVDFSWMGSAANFDSGYSGGLRAQFSSESLKVLYTGSASNPVVKYSYSGSTGRWARGLMHANLASDEERYGGLWLGILGSADNYTRGAFGFGNESSWWQTAHLLCVYPDKDPTVGPSKTIHHTGNLPQATQAELNAGTQTAPRVYAPKTFYDAAAFVAHNIANPLNLNTSNNFTISITVNSTLANATGAKSGQTGTLHITHDEDLTLSFGSAWKFIGGVPELPNTAGQAVITYQVVDTTNILATFGEIE